MDARLERMQRVRRRRAHALALFALVCAVAAVLSGCASPGPPRPPSLHLPRVVSDLTASRSGKDVELRFTVPTRTTDDQPIRETVLRASLCRQVGGGPCVPVETAETRAPLPVSKGEAAQVVWRDPLPAALVTGPPRAIAYRLEIRSGNGRTAGYSDPAFAAAGEAPAPVSGLRARGTRLGVELEWIPVADGGEVLLQRTAPVTAATGQRSKKKESGVVWLQAAPGQRSASATMDRSVEAGVPYTYLAVRRQTAVVGARSLELRSTPSEPVSVTWRDVYPPAAPQGLTALGYEVPPVQTPGAAQAAPGYAVDLVWEPVEDARLAGYVVYRQQVNAAGEGVGPRVRLTPQPIPTPGFHDATAARSERYRYAVTAIDPKGNESAAAEAIAEPEAVP